jgi:hypothetical protein|tara:strand:+ start:608 stop:826 length:219 start_codon:yes stop_codon:yes gene_type:complete
MATQNTFVIEYGLSVGSSEVINSSGKIVAAALTSVDSDDIAEGTTNTYFTTSRFNSNFDTRLSNATIDGGTI